MSLLPKTGLVEPGGIAMRIAIHDYAGHPFQFELSRELARRGHTVRHFFFADDPGPKGSSEVSADDPVGFSIEPLRLRMRYVKDQFVRRSVADHLYGRIVQKRLLAFQPDIIVSGNTPLDTQKAVQRAARKCGASFVFWVQDFYSIAIERLLSGRWGGIGTAVARHYRRIEESLLERSDSIVLISEDFRQYLPDSVAGRDSIHVIRNWGALNAISPVPKRNPWAASQGLTDKLVFMYTGTLALKHNPALLLALSDAFAQDDDVMIVVVASGVSAEALQAENRLRPRPNLKLLPLQAIADMPDVLGSADVLLAVLESDAAEFSVPSKLLSYLCAAKPILLSAPARNLATQVLKESGAGLHAGADDTGSFVSAACQLRQDSMARERLGAAGRAYAEANFDVGRVASRFERAMGIGGPAADLPGKAAARVAEPIDA
jgi:glycosyltransferase involved in cell wall biosynthesis